MNTQLVHYLNHHTKLHTNNNETPVLHTQTCITIIVTNNCLRKYIFISFWVWYGTDSFSITEKRKVLFIRERVKRVRVDRWYNTSLSLISQSFLAAIYIKNANSLKLETLSMQALILEQEVFGNCSLYFLKQRVKTIQAGAIIL